MNADCSAAGVQVWANGIQLPTCVGTSFCGAYGRLPQSIPELTDWGTKAGYRNASGAWSCGGTGAAATGSGTPSTSILPTSGAAGLNLQQLLIPGAVLAAVLLLKK